MLISAHKKHQILQSVLSVAKLAYGVLDAKNNECKLVAVKQLLGR